MHIIVEKMLPIIINFITSVIILYKIIGTSRAICIYTILIPVIKIKCSLHIKGTGSVTSVYYSSYYDVLLTIAYIKFITSATVTTYSFIFLWIWMKMPHIL